MSTKPLMRRVHLWVSAVAALPLLILGATGALLVFPQPLHRVVHDVRLSAPSSGDYRPASELLAAAQAVLPSGDHPVRVQYPPEIGDALSLTTRDGVKVVMDPVSARVLHVAGKDGFDVHAFLLTLHVSLFAGETGQWITALASIALLVLSATGIYLWWPRGKWAAHYFLVKWSGNRLRLNYDLHRATGFYGSVFLCLIALTGATMSFYDAADRFLHAITGSTPAPPAPKKVAVRGGRAKMLGPDEIVARAIAHTPGAPLFRLYVPKADDEPYRVFLTPAHDRQSRFEEVRLVLDPYDGAILHEDGPRTLNAADAAMRWLLPLHFGTFGGMTTRLIYTVVSASPFLFAITGFVMWRKRQLARGATRAPAVASEPASENASPAREPAPEPARV